MPYAPRCLTVLTTCFFVLLSLATAPGRGENWSRFRGPNGAGISSEKGFPVAWSDSDYLWKTKLPGLGHSSPCVWDDHVFVTSAENQGRVRIVLDVSATTGEIRWARRLDFETDKLNQRNSHASATPACDGQRVYVAFGSDPSYLLVAFDLEGTELWRYDLGPFESQHGTGISPVVFEDLVILGNDQDGSSFIVAVDAKTGKLRWKVDRNVSGAVEKAASYATPIVINGEFNQQELIFTSQADGMASYDPRTGKLNWRADIFPARCCGSPVYGNGLLFATCGGGGQGKYMAAVKPGGSGDRDGSAVTWKRERVLPYVPTPIVYGDHLYLWGDNGIVNCVVAKTGEEKWSQRLEGRNMFSGSPICVDGKLYCVSEAGDVIVLAASPEFQVLGSTPLGEGSHATPAVSNGRMFIRGFEHLFCLEAKK